MSEMTDQITSEMTISEILSGYPAHSQRIAQALTNAGLHCTNCSAATWETLEAGMLSHGMDQKAIDRLVDELNEILNEKIDLSTIAMTPQAAEKFKLFSKEEGLNDAGLRFGDQAGGCGGFQYLLDFCENGTDEDDVFESHGVKVYVNKLMTNRLLGCVIDYVDGLHGAGFKVSNPNVKSSCGCGSSQNY